MSEDSARSEAQAMFIIALVFFGFATGLICLAHIAPLAILVCASVIVASMSFLIGMAIIFYASYCVTNIRRSAKRKYIVAYTYVFLITTIVVVNWCMLYLESKRYGFAPDLNGPVVIGSVLSVASLAWASRIAYRRFGMTIIADLASLLPARLLGLLPSRLLSLD